MHKTCFSFSNSNILLIGSLCAAAIAIASFLYLSHYEMSESSQPGNNGPGQIISSVRWIRLAIFLITTSLIAACAVLNVIDFDSYDELPLLVNENGSSNLYGNISSNENASTIAVPTTTMDAATASPSPDPAILDIPPIYLFLCGLSLSAISVFLRAGFILKLFMMLLTVLLQTLVLYSSRQFEQFNDFADDSQ